MLITGYIKKKSNLIACLLFIVYIALIVIYGLIPGKYINDLSANYLMSANPKCLLNQGVFNSCYCMNYGLNAGYPFAMGLPYIYLAAFMGSFIGYDGSILNIIAGNIFLFVAFMSAVYLFYKLGVNIYLSIFMSFIYMVLYINYGEAGFHYMMYGFILLPLYILASVVYFDNSLKSHANTKQILLNIFVYTMIQTFALFMDGYSFMMSAVAASCICICVVYKRYKEVDCSKNRIMLVSCGFISAYVIAVILYRKYIPFSSEYSVMPIDYFRGQGVDLSTMVIPGSDLLYARLLGIGKEWNSFAYYGDSNNVIFNYCGYTLIICFLTSLFIMRNSIGYRLPILLAGIIALFLSFGPSLKINDHRDSIDKAGVEFSDYLMPPDKATVDLHTDFLYQKIPGINIMRAVNRWLLLFKFSLLLGAGIFLTYLKNKKKYVLSVLISILILFEMMPDMYGLHLKYTSNHRQYESFNNDIIKDLEMHVTSGEKVFFLSNENDFLVNYIASTINIKSFNCGGDKNMLMSMSTWPRQMLELKHYHNINENAYFLLNNKIIDTLIIPFFNLRWDSYCWPPDDKNILKEKSTKMELFNLNDKRFKVSESKWFLYIEL